MKHLLIFIFSIPVILTSCQSDDLVLQNTSSNIVGIFQFEKTSIYPTVGKEISITNELELTFTQDYKKPNRVLIEELGVYATINENKIDIPFQTDTAGQFSYTGYGEIIGTNVQLFLNIRNHTSNTIQTSEMHGQRVRFLD